MSGDGFAVPRIRVANKLLPSTKLKTLKTFKQNYYKKPTKKCLEVGIRGFLVTCNFRERDCIRECYNLLNEYGDQLYGTNKNKSDDKKNNDNYDKLDISEQLERDIEESNRIINGLSEIKHDNRFLSVKTGTNNCIFIKTTLQNPTELGVAIIHDLAHKKIQKTRHLLRLIPIECVCKANMSDIINVAAKLFDKFFLTGNKKYSIIYNRRYNNTIRRELIIKELADLVSSKNITNKVDLKHPDYSIVVEIVKGFCLINVLPYYIKWKKYNLHELTKFDLVSNVMKIWE